MEKNRTDIFPDLSNNTRFSGLENNTSEVNTTAYFEKFYPLVIDWVQYVEIGILVLISAIGIPANSLLLLIKLKGKDRTSTDYLVVTLAAFDLFGATYNNILLIVYSGFQRYVVSPTLCKLIFFGAYLVGIETAVLIGAMALDRFILSIFPLNRFYNANVAKWFCIIISILCVLFTSPYFFFVTMHGTLLSCSYAEGADALLSLFNRLVIGLAFATFVIIAVSYLSIAVMLRRRHLQRLHARSNAKKALGQKSNNDGETSVSDSNSSNLTQTTLISESSANSGIEQGKDKPLQQQKDVMELKRRAMNRTTLILFLISLIYMVTWIAASFVMGTNFALPKAVARLVGLTRKMTMISNPLLYMSMSSKSRRDAKKILCHR